MSRRSTLRASDADRDRVTERLRIAAAEGRLGADELDERVGVALSAKTYGELEPLVADLPSPPPRRRPPARVGTAGLVLGLVALVTLLGIAGAVLGHAHGGHHGGLFAGGPPIVWLVAIAVFWRMRLHRRHGTR